ncbi:OsmC family peroxiredoxin [Flavobacterium arcticum]|uniref:OsmC family peroxiredoxin n=1 Tax=Flavobacterium arcticum TaxID=1784713 RepID=A0A345HER4_9FLAO|nr:OsmC family protein [Flavobacterium arcticum]AXG75074.1 OsmC family peroxiredoxin [Flavobacterium arcticum]KAF2511145.1 OsmC family protein [Flavobacterium arcticum]
MTSKVTYLGNLRTSSVHLQSGNEILSDAPLDNNGKGEAFSPTDTVANGLASCMLTVMGIKAGDMSVNIEGSIAEVTKYMQSEPRRISKIEVVFTMKSDADEKARTILERTALTCPVHKSLHPDIEKDVTFNW